MTLPRARLAAALFALALGARAERPAAPDQPRGVQLAGGFEGVGAGVALRSARYLVTPTETGVALQPRPTSDERLAAGRPTTGPDGGSAPAVLAGAVAPLPRPDRRPLGLDHYSRRRGRVPDDHLLRPG